MTSCRTCLVFGFRHPKSGPCHPSNTLSGSASNPIKDLDTYEGMRDEKKQVKKEQFEEFEQDGLRDVSVLFFNGQKDTGSRPPEARSRRALRERERARERQKRPMERSEVGYPFLGIQLRNEGTTGSFQTYITVSNTSPYLRRYDWIFRVLRPAISFGMNHDQPS